MKAGESSSSSSSFKTACSIFWNCASANPLNVASPNSSRSSSLSSACSSAATSARRSSCTRASRQGPAARGTGTPLGSASIGQVHRAFANVLGIASLMVGCGVGVDSAFNQLDARVVLSPSIYQGVISRRAACLGRFGWRPLFSIAQPDDAFYLREMSAPASDSALMGLASTGAIRRYGYTEATSLSFTPNALVRLSTSLMPMAQKHQ